MGYRLVAVDGTKIRLPLDPDLAEAFGTQGNLTATERPMALYVGHYDASTKAAIRIATAYPPPPRPLAVAEWLYQQPPQ